MEKIFTIRISYWKSLFLILFLAASFFLVRQIQHIKAKQKIIGRSFKQMQHLFDNAENYLGNAHIPQKLSNLTFGEELGIVVETYPIPIRNVTAYNPSLIPTESGYDLFFRYDVISSKSRVAHFLPRVGVSISMINSNRIAENSKESI